MQCKDVQPASVAMDYNECKKLNKQAILIIIHAPTHPRHHAKAGKKCARKGLIQERKVRRGKEKKKTRERQSTFVFVIPIPIHHDCIKGWS